LTHWQKTDQNCWNSFKTQIIPQHTSFA